MNFKISELIHSDEAVKHNINNMPDINSLDNILELISYCLQPIRDKLKKPMVVSSGFRNSMVNKLVGGSATSEHLKGMAADFTVPGMTVMQVVDFIRKSDVKFTQLIEEHGKSSTWVHISYNKNNLKKEVLKYQNGKYIKI